MRNEKKSARVSGRFPAAAMDSRESGQIMVSMLLMLAIFLLAIVGFAVDLTNLWFHRQAVQTAADAACEAGAADMLVLATGTSLPNMGFTPGTPGDCTSGAGTICFYANANGYNGAGFSADAASNSVSWSFPSSVPSVTTPPASTSAYPFLKVVVTENVKTHFLYTIHGTSYQKVAASCTCGLSGGVQQGAPILVLNPTIPEALYMSGGAHIVIVGGPSNSIQVNSSADGAPNANSSSNAVYCDGGNGYPIDTSMAGPTGQGGNLSVHGGPGTNQLCGANKILYDPAGTHWKSPVATVANPYASVPAPTLPAAPVAASHPVPGAPARPTTQGTWVATGVDSCPNTNPTQHYLTYSAQYGNVYGNCLEFNPGYYPSGIDLTQLAGYSSDVAIFMPGVYYLNGNLHVGSSATIRNAWTGLQPSTQGVMFYFVSGGPAFDGGSGQPSSYINPVPSYYLNCSGTTGSSLMPASLTGNVLAAQCTTEGTYVGAPSTDVLSDSGNRGLLFNMASSNVFQGTVIGAGASLNFSGVLYFHNSTYQDQVTLNGAGSSTTYLLGDIVTDQLTLSGSGTIKMGLLESSSGSSGPAAGMFQ
jgi:Flp pilus assembly protein TadG